MGGCRTDGSRTGRTSVAVAVVAALVLSTSCAREKNETADAAKAPSTAAPASLTPARDVAVLEVKGFGTIRFQLLADKAPKTVENFEKLANSGFYDGTTFHRVIPGFMIQGGDPNTKNRDPRDDGLGGPGYTIAAEFNDTSHVRGVVSMARAASPNSAGSQFFIVVADSPHLDGQYTAFGRVIEGMDVVDKIVAVPRDEFGRHGPPDRPLENVLVDHLRIDHPGAAEARPPAAEAAGTKPPSASPAASAETSTEPEGTSRSTFRE
jgi:peptidyl-prolyl cis-trans isomerase B (cyclophilin B)